MKVPLVDLQAQYKTIQRDVDSAIYRVVNSSNFVLGEEVDRFECEFAEYLGVNHCIGVNSGTSALYLSLLVADIGRGDEVIIPANTFIATAEAVSMTGARPVLVDIDSLSYNIDPTLIEAAITHKTKAIIPVHLYGQCADMYPIVDICKRHRLLLIEDACQAVGAEYGSQKAGSFSDLAAFSFFPSKNLGCYGEGGAIVTGNKYYANKLRQVRNHGGLRKYEHHFVGGNYRLEALQAAILRAKLPHLDQWNNARNVRANWYNDLFEDRWTPTVYDYGSHVFHLYVVRVDRRDELVKFLNQNEIGVGIHYPTPIHLTMAYSDLGYGYGSFPVTEKAAREIISLPMYPELSIAQVEYVCEKFFGFYGKKLKISAGSFDGKDLYFQP